MILRKNLLGSNHLHSCLYYVGMHSFAFEYSDFIHAFIFTSSKGNTNSNKENSDNEMKGTFSYTEFSRKIEIVTYIIIKDVCSFLHFI